MNPLVRMISIFSLLLFVQFSYGNSVPVPENYSIIDTVTGDLDKDGVAELVVAYNTTPVIADSFQNIPRVLIVYKKKDKQWNQWKRSSQALYGSRDGGMMGDPFGGIEISDGVLKVNQNGGSSWKWEVTDKYRFQEREFYLIGYSSQFGKECEYWQDVDFNLLNGVLIVKKEYENCDSTETQINKREEETTDHKGLKITMQDRNSKDIKIVTKKYGFEINVAMKNDK